MSNKLKGRCVNCFYEETDRIKSSLLSHYIAGCYFVVVLTVIQYIHTHGIFSSYLEYKSNRLFEWTSSL